MDVRPIVPLHPVDSVQQVAPLGVATPHVAPGIAAAIAAIIDIEALSQLSLPDMGKLIRILDPPAPSPELLRSAISAAQSGDVSRALEQLAEFVKLDPGRAQTLSAEPGLEPIRTQVIHLLNRLETVAGLDAQGRLAQAAQALESPGPHVLAGWDTPPQTLLTMADRLYDAGGYVNYVHAASLAQVVIAASGMPVGIVRRRPAGPRQLSGPWPKPSPRLKALWRRAPLLILLVSWFVIGLAGIGAASFVHYFWPGQFPASIIATGFALWGIGFPALVAFGFFMRVRHKRPYE